MGKWLGGRQGAYFFLLLGISMLLLCALLEYRFPAAAQLEQARGRVVWQQETRAAVYFRLSDQRQFVLYTKVDPAQRQRAAVRDAVMYPLTVRFLRAQKTTAGYAPGDFYPVYGVAVGGKEVLPYEAVRSAYRRDNLAALWLGLILLAAGAWRLRITGPAPSPNRAGGGRPASRRSR